MVARQGPDTSQVLVDVSDDPVPSYEEVASSASDWQMVERGDNNHAQGDGNLIDLGSKFESIDDDVRQPQDSKSKILTENDVVIAIMGVTGAGKSTFVSQLTAEMVTVGHDLASCTTEPGVYDYSHRGKTIRLVDTPGFDDTNRSDTDILKDIAFFFSSLYIQKVKLAGIIYLHRITDVRMTGSAVRNLQMLEKLCGDEGLPKVMLVSTMWNLLTEESGEVAAGLRVGEEREKMLKGKFWGDMIRKGSSVARHYGDRKSGQNILDEVLDDELNKMTGKSSIVLDIQRELVDQTLSLDQTSAGRFLQKDLIESREKFEREIKECQADLEDAKRNKDKELVAELEKQQEEYKQQIGISDSKSAEIKVDFKTLAKENENGASQSSNEWHKENKSRAEEIKFIEQNLAELQDALERQERDHRAEIARLMKSQRVRSTESTQLIMQQKELFETQNLEMRLKIEREKKARLEKEAELKDYKRKKSGGGFAKFFGSFLNFFGEDEERGGNRERRFYEYDDRHHDRNDGRDGRHDDRYDDRYERRPRIEARPYHEMQDRRYRP